MTLSAPPSNARRRRVTGTVTIEANNGSAVGTSIAAPSNVVAGAGANGYVDLPVTLSAPGSTRSRSTTPRPTGAASPTRFLRRVPTSIRDKHHTDTLTFLPGVTTQVVRVPLLNCPQTQNLTFTLNLSERHTEPSPTRPPRSRSVTSRRSRPSPRQRDRSGPRSRSPGRIWGMPPASSSTARRRR